MVPSVSTSTWAAATTAATLTEAELRIVVRGQEEESAKWAAKWVIPVFKDVTQKFPNKTQLIMELSGVCPPWPGRCCRRSNSNSHYSGSDKTPELGTEIEYCALLPGPDIAVNYLNNSRTPVAIIFGWGGSSHKNVSKYSAIYHRAGCITVQYVLATR